MGSARHPSPSPSYQPESVTGLRMRELYQKEVRWVMVEMTNDSPGALQMMLEAFQRLGVNVTHIESRFKTMATVHPPRKDPVLQQLVEAIKQVAGVSSVALQRPREVPWFPPQTAARPRGPPCHVFHAFGSPLNINDLDLTRDTLDGGTDLINKDHPGYLKQTTGFQLRPVAGLGPDVCHELMGHVPLFANMDFADFSQEIGLASIGASDEDINRLASVYWFSVEFGVLREGGDVKAYGAGLLSSFGEMEWACDAAPSDDVRKAGAPTDKATGALMGKPLMKPFEPKNAASQEYPITTYQPIYFCADSLRDAKQRMDVFCDSLQRPFHPQYCALTQSIRVTKSVTRMQRTNTVQLQAEKQRALMEGQEG
eukprot:gene45935-17175_t